jgi:hypothetical protein
MGIEAHSAGWFHERPVQPAVAGSRVWLLYVAAAVMAVAGVVGALGRVPAAQGADHAPAVHRVATPTDGGHATR